MSKAEQPVVGVPYYVGMNPYQAGMVPPNAIYADPKGIPIQQTMYRDTPAPFNCPFCGNSGLTVVRYLPLTPFLAFYSLPIPTIRFLKLGNFVLIDMRILSVASFEKSDPCAVVDVPQWKQESFAVPA
ncbi:hypothetical protein QQP08_007455 [Theobroma cacao]|nr:hypothetical protein QQP08_007455 [Theobroma cacao]